MKIDTIYETTSAFDMPVPYIVTNFCRYPTISLFHSLLIICFFRTERSPRGRGQPVLHPMG